MFLEFSRININKKKKIKEFNHIFITLLKKIYDKSIKAVQIEFYITTLLPPIFMFVKGEKKQTLVDKLEEVIKVENESIIISNHLRNEESKASTSEKNGKKNKGTSNTKSDKKEKDLMDMKSMQWMIKQLTNENIDLNKNKGEGKKPYNPFIKKRTNTTTPLQIHPSLGINLEDYDMDNFCRTHHANDFEKTCLEFINSFLTMLLLSEPPKKDKTD